MTLWQKIIGRSRSDDNSQRASKPGDGQRRNYYVYLHKDASGQIFYVGKGTGKRAWSLDRHPIWQKYVSHYLNGVFETEIYRDDLSEPEAETLESELISEYGEQLVNWINPGRQFDYDAIKRFHELRNKNRTFVAETRAIEKSNPHEAAKRYRQALTAMREYEEITLEYGLVAELGGGPDWGDPNILDRLTLCLIRNGTPLEAVKEADMYFEDFPSALNLSVGKRIKARIEKQRMKSIG